MYEIVDSGDENITANDAFLAAAQRTKYGSTGYLMTVTSEAENDFISPRLSGDGWFGASDAATEGDWKWASGPELGTSFWSGLSNGSPVASRYSNWADGEPNNSSEDESGEDCAQFYSDGGWNDLSCLNTLNYYVVEYGAEGDLPEVSNTSFSIQTTFPEGEVVPIDSCTDLIAIAENELDHRYDTLQLTQNIDCAEETVTPIFSGGDEEYGTYTFRGTFDGQGFSISNLSMSANDWPYGLIRYSEFAAFEDITIASGSIEGSGCVGALVGEAENSSFINISSSANVTGHNDIGGIVGCLYSNNNNSSEIINSTGSGSVDSIYSVGGIVGYASSEGESTLTLDSNQTNTGEIEGEEQIGGLVGVVDAEEYSTITVSDNVISNTVSGYWGIGGMIGEAQADDEANLNITGNESSVSIEESYSSVGGLIGYLSSDEDSVIVIDENTAEGNISAEYSAGGLIGQIYVEDTEGSVTISNSSSSGDVSVEDDEAGGLVGSTDTDDDQIVINIQNSFSSSNVSGYNEVGGLVGFAHRMNITDSYATGTITGTAYYDEEYNYSYEIGGLTGESDGTTITDSYATGNVTGSYEVGGLVGFADLDEDYIYNPETDDDDIVLVRSEVIRSYYEGTVTGSNEVGGLVGDNEGGRILQSYANAEVVGVANLEDGYYDEELDDYIEGEVEIAPSEVGGLVGRSSYDDYEEDYDPEIDDYIYVLVPGVIEESYSIGTVSANSQLGGLVGNSFGTFIENSYSKSSVTAEGSNQAEIGGAIGANEAVNLDENERLHENEDAYINSIYSTGTVTSSEAESVGGLIGNNIDDFPVTNSFWDVQTSGLSQSEAGTGKTTAQMKDIATYTDLSTEGLEDTWDFSEVWGIYADINNGYPCLSWSAESCSPNLPDEDSDGVPDAVESAGPNNGDANNDGIPDSQQSNVASFVNPVTSNYAVLEVNDQCSIQSVTIIAESDVSNIADSGFDYPAGLMDFRVDCDEDGFTATVKQYYYGISGNFSVRKYIPSTGAYTNIPGATVQDTTIASQAVKIGAYQLTDGSIYDIDGEVNGSIEDPAGLAQSTVGSPNTGIRQQ